MIKLIRLFGLFVIICLIYGLGSAFNGNESSTTDVVSKESSTEIVKNDNSKNYVSTESSDGSNDYQIQEQKDVVANKTENKDTINDEKVTKTIDEEESFEEKKYIKEENKEEVKNEIITKSEIKEGIDNSGEIVENSANDETINDDVIVKNDIKDDISKEDVIVEIDEEYETLKKLYKYKTGTECYYASLKVYSQTYQEKYKTAGCISGAYNGELLGYRIIIYFNDGTSMYYDEAI